MYFGADGSKRAFILDKPFGPGAVSIGYTPDELVAHLDEMRQLATNGKNVYITPLSTSNHHILVDDMSIVTLTAMIDAGFAPAVVIESSPENFQAVFITPKLGTAHDNAVGNRLCLLLNRGLPFGDPKISGAVHPHRVPGLENRKQKHQRPDGTFPKVTLRRAEHRTCVKLLAISVEINAELQTAAEARAGRTSGKSDAGGAHAGTGGSTAVEASADAQRAFKRHFHDVCDRMAGAVLDLSIADSMVAVRMRVTGWSQGEIEGVLFLLAPASRKITDGDGPRKNWADYAKRTVTGYAFGPKGDREILNLRKYEGKWKYLEKAGV